MQTRHKRAPVTHHWTAKSLKTLEYQHFQCTQHGLPSRLPLPLTKNMTEANEHTRRIPRLKRFHHLFYGFEQWPTICLIHRDISASKNRENRLIRRNKTLQRFLQILILKFEEITVTGLVGRDNPRQTWATTASTGSESERSFTPTLNL